MNDFTSTRCYVLGLETQIGLSLVRELGSAGVEVIGIAQSETALGLSSRYLRAATLLKAPRTVQGLAELREIGNRFGPGTLLVVSEANMQWLLEAKEALGVISPVLPDANAFATVLDKTRTLKAAEAVGIAVPETASPMSWADVVSLSARCRFPVVLKWADPARVSGQLAKLGLSLEKAEHIHNAEQLLKACARYKPLGQWPIVQEYCPGIGLGQFFFMHNGQAVRRFQHVRIAEWPPEGGFSSVCDVVPLTKHKELQEKSIALLQLIGWSGVAMVEYRYDPSNERSVLMEINGRFWGSYPLALHAGAGFALIGHSIQATKALPNLPDPVSKLRARMVATELKRLFRILIQPNKITDRHFQRQPVHELCRFVFDFFRPSVCYYVWTWRDPFPFLKDLRNMLRGN